MKKVKLHDKEFELLIDAATIDQAIAKVADKINSDLKDTQPLFLSILNGSFMFTSDLLKQITVPGTEICFMKIASYAGTSSTGKIKELIGCNVNLAGRTIVILEDMIDSGRSMTYLIEYLQEKRPKAIKIATMFYKPKALTYDIKVDYCALELENDFVVGRGLDYDGLGRNYPDLYILSNPE
ncbi:phosphoribosyltransferase [uncultured Odoribacter sp.]|uniref:phosphoribosyltransferase n=1 Tax=uncultured Odoribacter sp. TaxID=876416 RepID=UPI0026140515|nr:phosphoribosyltransferase family protein [uncultured Odoribacter sp.]